MAGTVLKEVGSDRNMTSEYKAFQRISDLLYNSRKNSQWSE
jgi:hypothetical protein